MPHIRTFLLPLLLSLFIILGSLPLPLLAATSSEVVAKQEEVLTRAQAAADKLSEEIDRETADDGKLVSYRLELEKLAREVFDASFALTPRLSEINQRLDQLGPARGENDPPEPEIVVNERQHLIDEKARFNVLIGEAERLYVRINTLIDQIAQYRRTLFAQTLSRRYDLSAALGSSVAGEFGSETAKIYRAVQSWISFTLEFRLRAFLFATLLALGVALCLLFGGRKLFGRFIEPDPSIEEPSYLSRLSVALFSTLIPTVAFAAFMALTYYFLNYFSLMRAQISELLLAGFVVITAVFFVYRLAQAILKPRMERWRLVPVSGKAAPRLVLLSALTAIVSGFDYFTNIAFEVFGSPLSLTVATSLLATVIVGLLIILIGNVKPMLDAEGRPAPWPARLRYFLWFLGAAIIAAALLGYIGFASFLSQQVVVTGGILATMYIGMLTAAAVSREGGFANSWMARQLERRSALDETTLDQLGLLAGMAINFLVLIIGAPLILLQWGFRGADLTAWLYRAGSQIQIGSLSFSLVGILSGLLIFIVGYFATRWFQVWLDGSVMARSRMDSGVRNSIRTAVGYAGIVFAALIGISAAGISLSSLALVAGALSLGIGFGLQNIVNNFVSGLILLVERPFKAGDWIVAGGVSGTVKKISVRATEIETFQRQTVILPNSELINAAVGNWTHKNKLGRVEIQIGVAYGTNVKRVHEMLLNIATSHPQVLKNPEPFVLFAGFGDSSLDFEVRVYLADILKQMEVQNDIRFAIVEAFEAENIEIPFPQRDIHLRTSAAPAVQNSPPVSAAPKPQKTSRRRKVDPE